MTIDKAREIRSLVSMASLSQTLSVSALFLSIGGEVDKKKDNLDMTLLAWLESELDNLTSQAIAIMSSLLESYTYQMALNYIILTDSADYNFLRLDKAKGYTSYWLPSDNLNYADRMINNMEGIKTELRSIFLTDVDAIVKLGLIHDCLQKAQNQWIRLIDTEIEAAYVQGARDGYLAEGCLYAIVENGDPCDECQDYVGEHEIDLETGVLGIDLPPYHPNCKCIFTGIFQR